MIQDPKILLGKKEDLKGLAKATSEAGKFFLGWIALESIMWVVSQVKGTEGVVGESRFWIAMFVGNCIVIAGLLFILWELKQKIETTEKNIFRSAMLFYGFPCYLEAYKRMRETLDSPRATDGAICSSWDTTEPFVRNHFGQDVQLYDDARKDYGYDVMGWHRRLKEQEKYEELEATKAPERERVKS